MPEFTTALNRVTVEETGFHVSRERFRQIVARIASEGGLYPDDVQSDVDLYEQAVLIETELEDYFSVMGAHLQHNGALRTMRLTPPNGMSPDTVGSSSSGEDQALGTNLLRRRVSAHVAAAALGLRLIYAQKLSTGDILGEGNVETTVEDLVVTMKSRLKREPAPTQQERRAVIRELERVWHVLRIATEVDTDDPTTRLVIRPLIADIISETATQETEADALSAGARPETDTEDAHAGA